MIIRAGENISSFFCNEVLILYISKVCSPFFSDLLKWGCPMFFLGYRGRVAWHGLQQTQSMPPAELSFFWQTTAHGNADSSLSPWDIPASCGVPQTLLFPDHSSLNPQSQPEALVADPKGHFVGLPPFLSFSKSPLGGSPACPVCRGL